MQSQVQIDFQGMKPVESLQEKVVDQVAGLEERFGRITACRVVLKAPGNHRRIGLYEVSLHLTLPDGKQVDIDRTPHQDERYSDLDFALNDAFKRARRRLQGQVHRLQCAVKTHETQPIGRVVRLHDDYGFLEAADGHEVYFHNKSVLNNAFARMEIGARVTFAEELGEKGPQASTVRLQGKHQLR
jgi:cold shock CspA family protein/ribosome-associated translation inhibitor RaiA